MNYMCSHVNWEYLRAGFMATITTCHSMCEMKRCDEELCPPPVDTLFAHCRLQGCGLLHRNDVPTSTHFRNATGLHDW